MAELSYSDAGAELDAIIEEFETGVIDVDRLVEQLERATDIVDELDRRLRRTRMQVEELVPRLEAIGPRPTSRGLEDDSESRRSTRELDASTTTTADPAGSVLTGACSGRPGSVDVALRARPSRAGAARA